MFCFKMLTNFEVFYLQVISLSNNHFFGEIFCPKREFFSCKFKNRKIFHFLNLFLFTMSHILRFEAVIAPCCMLKLRRAWWKAFGSKKAFTPVYLCVLFWEEIFIRAQNLLLKIWMTSTHLSLSCQLDMYYM